MVGAIVIFGYLGYFSKLTQTPIDQLPIIGSDLVFVTIPAALICLPFPEFWLILFFVSLIFIGIDSQLGVVEACGYMIADINQTNNGPIISSTAMRGIVCFAIFCAGLFYSTKRGFEILCFVNEYCIFLPYLSVAFFQVLIFGFLMSEFI